MRPSQEQAPETRNKILEAAGNTIDLLGYRRFRVEDVAAAAGMSRQTVVNYFPKKEDLVWASTEARMRAFETALAARIAELDDRATGFRVAMRENLAALAAIPGTSPPLLDDMIAYLTGTGAGLVHDQFRSTAKVLADGFGANAADADVAGEVLVRLVLGFLLLPSADRDLDHAADVITASVVAILDRPPDRPHRLRVTNVTRRPGGDPDTNRSDS